MKTIRDFENSIMKFNENNMYRTCTQIAFDPEYYDVLTTFDSDLEIDLFTFNEDTMIELVNYLESLNVYFLRPDYIPNISYDLERLGIPDSEPGLTIYKEALKLNGTCEEKYMYDEDEKKFRTQIRIGAKNIRTFYQFVKYTKDDLIKLADRLEDAIQITPYQIDNIIDGKIIYFEGEEFYKSLEFKFDASSPKTAYITAAIINQTVRNQGEFDELGFNVIG